MKTHIIDGYEVQITVRQDPHMGEPWKEHDGHGVVSEWVKRDKRPGELVLNKDRGMCRFYDYAATLPIARRDGWGLDEPQLTALANRIGRKPSKREAAAESVRLDFEHLRAWCNDEWQWQGFTTKIITPDGEELDGDSVWGYDGEEYMLTEAVDMARHFIAQHMETNRETELAACWP